MFQHMNHASDASTPAAVHVDGASSIQVTTADETAAVERASTKKAVVVPTAVADAAARKAHVSRLKKLTAAKERHALELAEREETLSIQLAEAEFASEAQAQARAHAARIAAALEVDASDKPFGIRLTEAEHASATRAQAAANATRIGMSFATDSNVARGAKKRPAFVPRAGDEEHAEAIAREMTDPAAIGVGFEDVAGQEEAKEAVAEAVIWPALIPDYYYGVVRPAKGVLLFGPPGTGKSMMAKAVASLGNLTFFNVTAATLVASMRGDSEKLIRVLFAMARHFSPSVIFIDEIDSLCRQRGANNQHEASRRALSVLLAQMDGVGVDASQSVMVLGATNHPWDIDEAMRRRLEKRIYMPLPNRGERASLLRLIASKQTSSMFADDVDFETFSAEIEQMHYSGADVSLLAREAIQMPLRRYVKAHGAEFIQDPRAVHEAVKAIPVTIHDFRAAVTTTPSSVDVGLLSKFDEWKAEFEQRGRQASA